MKFLKNLNNFRVFILLGILWLAIFIMFFLYFDKEIFFICNDSFQYMSIAKKIYKDGTFNQLANFALDLYYDELAIFNYDFNNIKPYHFPSYSAFLSLFYHISNNDKIVAYLSQYIAFLIFSISSFLILSNYLTKKEALLISIISMIFSPILYYVSDSGKEIICSGLSLLVLYLTLYKKNNLNPFNLVLSCLILIFLSVTRSFYLLLGLLIAIYLIMPSKYKKDSLNPQLSFKIQTLIFTLFFLIPLISYIYCYFYLDLHFFAYDNRTDIYGGKSIDDLFLRILNNFFLSYPASFINLFNNGVERIFLIAIIHLYLIFFIVSNGLFAYLYFNIKKFKFKISSTNIKKIKISRLGILTLFNIAILTSVSIRFGIAGYRLLISYTPFVFLIFYQILIIDRDKTNKFKIGLYISGSILLIFLCNNFLNLSYYKSLNNNIINVNKSIIAKIENTNSKKIIIDNLYPNSFASLPLFNLYSDDIYFFSTWQIEELCDNLKKYHEKNLDFDLVFLKKEFKSCDYFNKTFTLNEINQFGFVYLKNH